MVRYLCEGCFCVPLSLWGIFFLPKPPLFEGTVREEVAPDSGLFPIVCVHFPVSP